MFVHGSTFPLKLKPTLSVEDWDLFEELADKNKKLWSIFWNISKDKERIVEENMCALYYLEEFVFPHLQGVMKSMVYGGGIDNNGLSIILSLYINMIPKKKCENCKCVMSEEDWIKKSV